MRLAPLPHDPTTSPRALSAPRAPAHPARALPLAWPRPHARARGTAYELSFFLAARFPASLLSCPAGAGAGGRSSGHGDRGVGRHPAVS